jgi:hypothetical protein
MSTYEIGMIAVCRKHHYVHFDWWGNPMGHQEIKNKSMLN